MATVVKSFSVDGIDGANFGLAETRFRFERNFDFAQPES